MLSTCLTTIATSPTSMAVSWSTQMKEVKRDKMPYLMLRFLISYSSLVPTCESSNSWIIFLANIL